MSQMQIRDKLRKIAEAVKDDHHIKERPKKIGLCLFFISTIMGIVAIFIFSILLALNSYFKTSFILAIIAIFSCSIVFKLITADDLHPL